MRNAWRSSHSLQEGHRAWFPGGCRSMSRIKCVIFAIIISKISLAAHGYEVHVQNSNRTKAAAVALRAAKLKFQPGEPSSWGLKQKLDLHNSQRRLDETNSLKNSSYLNEKTRRKNGSSTSTNTSANVECRHVREVAGKAARCRFVDSTPDCDVTMGKINYPHFVYCTTDSVVLPSLLLVVWLAFLFIMLGTTADEFFCPSLAVISKILRMNQNIAGVTLLAFGNGAPDIFTAIVAVTSSKGGDLGLPLGALLGAAVFVTTCVVGSVSLAASPFQVRARPFLRDSVFYIAAIFWIFYLLYSRQVTSAHALGFIGLYVTYVAVVLVGKYINIKLQMGQPVSMYSEIDEPIGGGVRSVSGSINSAQYYSYRHDNGWDATNGGAQVQRAGPSRRGQYPAEDDDPPPPTRRALRHMLDSGGSLGHSGGAGGNFNRRLVESDLGSETPVTSSNAVVRWTLALAAAVVPLDVEAFREKTFLGKVYALVKVPAVSVLNLTTPVVPDDDDDDDGADPGGTPAGQPRRWTKPLALLHVLTAPQFCCWALGGSQVLVDGMFPVPVVALIVSLVIFVLVAATSVVDRPPAYYPMFSFAGFVVSLLWIYTAVKEIVNVLETFGIVLNISNAILGLTLLAWGNSLGDLVADTVTAKQGYPVMATSACFGGTLFNILLGVGLPFALQTLRHGTYHIKHHALNFALIGGLGFSLVSSFLIIPLCRFTLHRAYGFYLVLVYVTFLTVALLTEFGIIS